MVEVAVEKKKINQTLAVQAIAIHHPSNTPLTNACP
jgi:hypothetical protein